MPCSTMSSLTDLWRLTGFLGQEFYTTYNVGMPCLTIMSLLLDV